MKEKQEKQEKKRETLELQDSPATALDEINWNKHIKFSRSQQRMIQQQITSFTY